MNNGQAILLIEIFIIVFLLLGHYIISALAFGCLVGYFLGLLYAWSHPEI